MTVTVADRGRGARAIAPRSSHAHWEPPADRFDPVGVLEAQAESRLPELVPIRHGRMLASPFAFYRGAAAIMAADLVHTPATGIRVQLCGDAHLANFGGFAAPDRTLVFDVNDFDETLPGPWEWDVKRLAASVAVAGRDRGFDATERAGAIADGVRGYRLAMRGFAAMRNLDVWYARLEVEPLVRSWQAEGMARRKTIDKGLAKAYRKDSLRAFEKLTHSIDGRPRIVSDPPLVVAIEDLLQPDEHALVEELLHGVLRAYRDSLANDLRHLLDSYRAVHFARKVVGVGSVGTRAWVGLLLGRDDTDPLFLQVKEAQRSVLEPYAGPSRYDTCGRRVVEGQRLMQAASDVLLGWLRGVPGPDGVARDFYVRQLWDAKASVPIEALGAPGLGRYAHACGWTLARAHARSGDRGAIAAYLGQGDRFDRALVNFAEAYADQNERDHAALAAAVESGRVEAQTGV
jgi:uncharacterized protein (DUF2252 family)